MALTVLLLINTWLAYRFGRLITGSQLAGGLVSLGVAYHAKMLHLVYLPAFVYYVLCFTFYFSALTYYISIRGRGGRLTKKQAVVFLLFYVGALDSKEMAVTLPVVVLLYEAVWHAPARMSVASSYGWMPTGRSFPGAAIGSRRRGS
ncbi:MAG: hypothetical protein ABSE56_22890 [Bryobacteraceae bacterium]